MFGVAKSQPQTSAAQAEQRMSGVRFSEPKTSDLERLVKFVTGQEELMFGVDKK